MTSFRSIMEVTADEWLEAMKLPESEIPDVIVVEGSWWRAKRTQWRVSYLTEVRELGFPDIFWGRWQGKKVAYCCAYGAPRTAEIIHLFGVLGTKLAVQIGTCGGLQPQLRSGDVILPEVAICRDGVSPMYGAVDGVLGSADWIDRAEQTLTKRGLRSHRGPHVTWTTLFTETPQIMEAWHHAGYLSVDMETATTFAVARHFGMPAVSLLVAWDDLMRGKRFVDPLTETEQVALDHGNQVVYEVALALTEYLP